MSALARSVDAPESESVGDGVWRVTGGDFPSNAYICAAGPAGEAFIVDPGLDPGKIDAAAQSLGLLPRQVFCTHGHFDHIGGAKHFQDAFGAEVFLHPSDLKTTQSGNFMLMLLKLQQRISLPKITAVEVNTPIPVPGGGFVSYIPVPGHTRGSCFIAHGEHLFTGDTLYARGVGLSKLPGENHDLLRQSLLAVWDAIPGERIVHPGHGGSARFDEVRRTNLKLRAFLGLDASEAPA